MEHVSEVDQISQMFCVAADVCPVGGTSGICKVEQNRMGSPCMYLPCMDALIVTSPVFRRTRYLHRGPCGETPKSVFQFWNSITKQGIEGEFKKEETEVCGIVE